MKDNVPLWIVGDPIYRRQCRVTSASNTATTWKKRGSFYEILLTTTWTVFIQNPRRWLPESSATNGQFSRGVQKAPAARLNLLCPGSDIMSMNKDVMENSPGGFLQQMPWAVGAMYRRAGYGVYFSRECHKHQIDMHRSGSVSGRLGILNNISVAPSRTAWEEWNMSAKRRPIVISFRANLYHRNRW